MSDKEENRKPIRVIDRLVADPDGRFDSDAGVTADLENKPWTLDEVRRRAEMLGKTFKPNKKIADGLNSDLAENGVVILFTEDDVLSAIELGVVSKDEEENLINLVSPDGYNDVVLIRANSMERDQNERLIEWFLTNNRC